MSGSDDFLDPFEAHFRREPLPGAAILVIVLSNGTEARGREVAKSLADLVIAFIEGGQIELVGRLLRSEKSPKNTYRPAQEPAVAARVPTSWPAVRRS